MAPDARDAATPRITHLPCRFCGAACGLRQLPAVLWLCRMAAACVPRTPSGRLLAARRRAGGSTLSCTYIQPPHLLPSLPAGYAMEKKSSIIAIGLTVHNAPVELREKLAVPEAEWQRAIEELCSYPHIEEAAVLSTCNRMEIYVVALSFHRGALLAAGAGGCGGRGAAGRGGK